MGDPQKPVWTGSGIGKSLAESERQEKAELWFMIGGLVLIVALIIVAVANSDGLLPHSNCVNTATERDR